MSDKSSLHGNKNVFEPTSILMNIEIANKDKYNEINYVIIPLLPFRQVHILTVRLTLELHQSH